MSFSGIRGDSLVKLVPGLWFPGLWVRLVPTEKAVIVETSIQSPPSPPHSVSVLIGIPTSPPFSPGSD